jgi:hypothetical protein
LIARSNVALRNRQARQPGQQRLKQDRIIQRDRKGKTPARTNPEFVPAEV